MSYPKDTGRPAPPEGPDPQVLTGDDVQRLVKGWIARIHGPEMSLRSAGAEIRRCCDELGEALKTVARTPPPGEAPAQKDISESLMRVAEARDIPVLAEIAGQVDMLEAENAALRDERDALQAKCTEAFDDAVRQEGKRVELQRERDALQQQVQALKSLWIQGDGNPDSALARNFRYRNDDDGRVLCVACDEPNRSPHGRGCIVGEFEKFLGMAQVDPPPREA